jgi:ADP-ribose pyrophosphatase YjhB (NUDIX family)/ubiquinone/menaquinone biosynthesis C-methylase UbiE
VQETIAAYDGKAQAFADRWFDLRLTEDMGRFTARLAPGVRVLDVGCGPGRDAAWLAEQGYQAVGVDLSEGMLREGLARGVPVPLIQADMAHMPFRKGSFRGLWVCASLLHIPKKEAADVLRELSRIVHPGHISVAVKRGEGEAWVTDEAGKRLFFAYYTPSEIELLMERSGFEVISTWENEDLSGRTHPWIHVLAWSKMETPRAGTCAIVLDEQNRVLLTQRADNGAWCLPGGHLDFGETVEQCAIREAYEETGLTVRIERLIGVYSRPIYDSAYVVRPKQYVILSFLCRRVGGELRTTEETTDIRYFDSADLPEQMIEWHRQRVADAVSGEERPFLR